MTTYTFGTTASSSRAVTHIIRRDYRDNPCRTCWNYAAEDDKPLTFSVDIEAARLQTAILLYKHGRPTAKICSKCLVQVSWQLGPTEMVPAIVEFGALTMQDPLQLTHTMLPNMTVGELDRMADYLHIDRDEAWADWLATRRKLRAETAT